LKKKVLDCGAGGDSPPLAIFHHHGYEVNGIELSEEQIKRSREFEKENGLELNISKGSMLQIPFEKESFSYVYSYNTIFHMRKSDIFKAINEIKRVLVPGGLCFVNVLSTNDHLYGEGEKFSNG
jgi:ubiquinone/menaquinone biosynthesis C-methylase UbiE